jgi:uncharacterized membrane protein YgcG
MKTNYFSSKKLSIYSLFGFGVMLLVSCGSSKNTSYNDNDGIYGGTSNSSKREVATNDNKYKEYFSNLNQENQEIFTDVENYSTTNDTVNKDTTVESNNNGWGSNASNVTINVYDNSWGYGYGGYWNNYWYGNNWAWNNWYGPSWGWNSWYGPNYGWGWNSWYGPYGYYGYPYYYGNGYYNNYYGNYYGNHYAYGNGRRDARIASGGINRYNANGVNRSSRRESTITPTRNYTDSSPRNNVSPRNNASPRSTTPRNYNNTSPRPNTTTNPRDYNNNNSPRPSTTTPSRDTDVTPRSTTSPSRDYNTNTPSRSNDTPRSYTPSSNSGSSGNSGGGRSSGGGGRR